MASFLEQSLLSKTPYSVMQNLNIGENAGRGFLIQRQEEERKRIEKEAEKKAERESAFNPVLSLLGAGLGLATGGVGGALLGSLQGIGQGEETTLDKALKVGIGSSLAGTQLNAFAPGGGEGNLLDQLFRQGSAAFNPQNVLKTAQLATGSTKGLEGISSALSGINALKDVADKNALTQMSTLKDFTEVPKETVLKVGGQSIIPTEYNGKYYISNDAIKAFNTATTNGLKTLSDSEKIQLNAYYDANQKAGLKQLGSYEEAKQLASTNPDLVNKFKNPVTGQDEWFVKITTTKPTQKFASVDLNIGGKKAAGTLDQTTGKYYYGGKEISSPVLWEKPTTPDNTEKIIKISDQKEAQKSYYGLSKEYRNDDIVKKAKEDISMFNDIESTVNSGSKLAKGTLQRQIARLYDKGALSNRDVEGMAGSQSVKDKLTRIITTGASGDLTDQDIGDIKSLVSSLKASKTKAIDDATNDFINTKTALLGAYYTPEQIKKQIGYTPTTLKPKSSRPPGNTSASNQFKSDADAFKAGYKKGQVIMMWNPKTKKYQRYEL